MPHSTGPVRLGRAPAAAAARGWHSAAGVPAPAWQPDNGGVTPRRDSLLLSLYLPELLHTIGWGMTLPVLPRLATEVTGNASGAAVVVALIGLGTLLFDIPAGRFDARWSRRTMLAVTMGVYVAAALLAGVSGSALLLGAAGLLLGACRGAWILSRMTYAREVVTARQRGRALAALGGTYRIGTFAVGPALGGALAGVLGLHAPFLAFAGMLLLALLAALRWTPDRPGSRASWYHPLAILRDHGGVLLRASTAVVALNMIRAARQLLIPLWGEAIGLSVAEVGLVMSAGGIVDMTLFYPSGLIMDRLGRRWAAAASILVMSASLALMPLTGSLAALLLVSVLAGAGNGLGSGLLMTMGTDLAPQRGAGEFIGLWRVIGDVGSMGGPAVIGAAAGVLTLALAGPVVALFGLAGTALFIFTVKETLHDP